MKPTSSKTAYLVRRTGALYLQHTSGWNPSVAHPHDLSSRSEETASGEVAENDDVTPTKSDGRSSIQRQSINKIHSRGKVNGKIPVRYVASALPDLRAIDNTLTRSVTTSSSASERSASNEQPTIVIAWLPRVGGRGEVKRRHVEVPGSGLGRLPAIRLRRRSRRHKRVVYTLTTSPSRTK